MTLFFACAAMAQESNINANGKHQYGPYETNRFWGNWFVEVGGGVNVPVDNVTGLFKGQMTYDFGGLAVNVNAGKWLDPCYGVRVGYQGLTTGNLNNNITFKDSFDGNHNFNYAHGDFLLNFSNLVAGYKEKRLVNVVPYVTSGAAWSEWNNHRSFVLGAGVEAPFRLSNRISLVPSVQLLAMNSHVYGGDAITGNASAMLNLRVNLGKTNWTRKATTVAAYEGEIKKYAGYLEDEIRKTEELTKKNSALKTANDNLTSDNTVLKVENEKLKKELAVANSKKMPNEFIAYFEQGKATLSTKEKIHMTCFLDVFLKPNTLVKVNVAGATDSGTGTVKRNSYLREARAKYIADLLYNTYGTQVKIVEEGLQDIDEPALSRAAVITWK